MARIPTLNIPQVQRAPVAGVPMDLESALAPSRGKMAIARAVGQLGQVAGEFAIRSAQAKEAATLAEQQRKQKESFAAFESELATTPNGEDWLPLWEKHKKAAQTGVDTLSKRLGSDGRARSQEMFANWATDNDVRVKTQTAVQSVRESKTALGSAAVDAWQDGDFASGNDYIDIAEQVGVMSKVEAADYREKGRKVVDIAETNRRIRENPAAATEWIQDTNNATNLSESERLAAINTAKVQTQNWRAIYSQEVGEKIFNVLENGASPVGIEDEIKTAVESGKMLATTASNHLKRLRGQTDEQGVALFAAGIWEQALAMPGDNTPETRAMEFQIRAAIAPLDPVLQKPILDVLENRRKPGGAKGIAAGTLEWLDKYFDSGAAGPTKIQQVFKTEMEPAEIDAPGLFTGDMPNPKAGQPLRKDDQIVYVYDDAGNKVPDEKASKELQQRVADNILFKESVKKQTYDWAKKNPDKTPEEILSYAKDLIDEHKVSSGSNLIYDSLDLNFTEDNGTD